MSTDLVERLEAAKAALRTAETRYQREVGSHDIAVAVFERAVRTLKSMGFDSLEAAQAALESMGEDMDKALVEIEEQLSCLEEAP